MQKIKLTILFVILTSLLFGCSEQNKAVQESNLSEETVQNAKTEVQLKRQEDTDRIPECALDIKGIEKYEEPVDYSEEDNWLSLPEGDQKAVDVVYLYPTVYGTVVEPEDEVADIGDITMRIGAAFSVATQASVFEESCNVYAPVYRQLTVSCLLDLIEDNHEAMLYIASKDLYRMLDHYFEHYNKGKPFILAGHSQGSVWLTVILEDYMKEHPEYLKNMVAAYVIGYSVTEEYLAKNPHLKFASTDKDTGVIVSYNTEGPGNKDQYNCVVREGAVCINPINWKRDDTYAPAEENLGSLGLTGEIVENYADARLDPDRGVVVCESITQSEEMQEMLKPYFGSQSYHLSDYSLYYKNLQKNAADRIDAFMDS